MSELLVRLIDKKDGGTRPILLFRALYRVHMRARQGYAKAWEAQWAIRGFNNSPTSRILDGSYENLVQSHVAAFAGEHACELLMDFTKFFDTIDRSLLWQAGVQAHYPLWLLRIALQSYSWQRRLIGQDGLASATLVPTRGVGPGSATAIFECKLFLLALVRDMEQMPVQISLHVDDLSLWCSGNTVEQMVSRMSKAYKKLRELLTERGLQTCPEKDGLVATNYDTFKAVADVLAVADGKTRQPHRFQGTPSKLGIDYSMGARSLRPARRRRGKQLGRAEPERMALCRARICKFRGRMRRSRIIFGSCAFRKVFKVGILPGLSYGADMVDYGQATLREADRAAKEAFGL
jgi:hypothetical protein